jgi:hypothetical protein
MTNAYTHRPVATAARLALLAIDVKNAGRTFKSCSTKFQRNTRYRIVVDKQGVTTAANELYFAARRAWREALALNQTA